MLNAKYNVCDTKDYFDTEFEATIRASKVSFKYGDEFEAYKCLKCNGWHICHSDPLKRRGYGKKFWRCPKCKLFEKKSERALHKCPDVYTMGT